jgi:hypothetical protein
MFWTSRVIQIGATPWGFRSSGTVLYSYVQTIETNTSNPQ